jgi:hypothetical protein
MQTDDGYYFSKESAPIINSDYVSCVLMWYSFCFQGCIRLAISLTKVANTDVSTIYLFALQKSSDSGLHTANRETVVTENSK